MTLEQSAGIMDAIFASPDEESRGRLLRILQDFLVSEAAKHTEQQKGTPFFPDTDSCLKFCIGSGQVKKEGGLDMAQLVGNTDDFADSGYVPWCVPLSACMLTNIAASVRRLYNVTLHIFSMPHCLEILRSK